MGGCACPAGWLWQLDVQRRHGTASVQCFNGGMPESAKPHAVGCILLRQYKAGFRNITNIDFSKVVIERMSAKYSVRACNSRVSTYTQH